MTTRRACPATRRWQRGLAILVILLAAGLRFNRLDAQSFWNDEGNTARLVERPLTLIIEGAAGDIHPPGYYLLLHGWRSLVGQTEFALRSYSALCGVAMVAVAIALGRRAGGGPVAGFVAGLCVAIHPLAVYYSQEARMYAQLGLAAALTLGAGGALRHTAAQEGRNALRAWGTTLSLAACIAFGLYTQYAYMLALVGLNLAFGAMWLAWRPRRRRVLTRWILAHALGGALFLPWAPIALDATGWQPPDLNQGSAIAALVRTLMVGTVPLQPDQQTRLWLAGGVLLLTGIITLVSSIAPASSTAPAGSSALAHSITARSRVRRRRFIGWAALSMAVVPAVIIAVAGIYRPAYQKFLMVSLVPLAVVWAQPFGVRAQRANGRRWALTAAALIAALTLGGAQVKALARLTHDPALARDDYRGVAALIRARGRPGDAVLLNAPNQWEVFTYYYGPAPQDELPVYPAPYRPTAEEAEAWVADVLAEHQGGRLFVLFWGDGESDPHRHIEAALTRAAFKAGERWVTAIRLAEYGVGPGGALPAEEIDAHLGEGIVLTQYGLPSGDFAPGDIVPMKLTWRADQEIEARLKVFVHLVDGAGALITQVDMEPQAGLAPTAIWQPGEHVVDRYGLALPQELAPDTYTIMIGMYRATGERLPITVDGAPIGDALQLAEITVRSTP